MNRNRLSRLENISDRSCAQSLQNQDDNIYYNVVIDNPTKKTIPATFSEQKVKTIIEHPEQYYLSVIRFSLSGQALPIFFFENNAYWTTLTYNNVNFSTPLIYVPLNNEPNAQQYVFQYQHMVDMINTAFLTSFNAMKVAYPASPQTEAPYMVYDATTNLFSLFCQQTYDDNALNTCQIWFNNVLYYFFDNFLTFYEGEDNADHKDIRFIIKDFKNNIPVAPANYYEFKQEFVSLFNWASLKTISFKSSTIPVRTEYTPAKTIGDVSYNPVMIDFEFDPSGEPALYRQFLTFNPTAQYRLIDLLGRDPISNINIEITWKDQNQNEFPFEIPPLKSVSMKMIFVKKDLYKNIR